MRPPPDLLFVLILFLLPTSVFARADMIIESSSGPVTGLEIDAFKTFMRTQSPPPTPWGKSHNAWSFNEGGPALESLCTVYEISNDTELLDLAITFADACIWQRNDLLPADKGGRRVLWTGKVEKVWCPEAPTHKNARYSGCESEDGVAHVAYCAKLILRHPELHNTSVPDKDPRHFGATYLERAKTYIDKCDESNDEYYVRWFVRPGTNLIRDPDNQPEWKALKENVDAINRQMMFDGGFQRLAECHEILGDAPGRVKRYDAIVKASVDECVAGMKSYRAYALNHHTVYDWSYYPHSRKGSESVGHGAYDVWGIFRAYQRPAYNVSLADVTPLASTMAYVIAKEDGTFATTVDGKGASRTFHAGPWVLLSEWNADVWDAVTKHALKSESYKRNPLETACILWEKDRRAKGLGDAADMRNNPH
jgi:hypothetical protein